MELTADIILAALGGDEKALLSVLQFYEAYMNSFAYEKYQDEYGNMRIRFDADTKQQLQENLLKALKKFDIERAIKE
jgi:hypothetical protein